MRLKQSRFSHFEKWFSNLPPSIISLCVIVLVAMIGFLDFLTGNELSFSIFYLLPSVLAGWFVGKKFGHLISILSASTWLTVDFASESQYSNILIPYWNALVRLGFFLIVISLISWLKSALEYQAVLAELDGLTGLLNARAFRQKSEIPFGLSTRNHRAVSLAYIDLDGFKGINDTLGHSTGDQVLLAVADTIKRRLRASDLCARLGGDEFAILLPETDFSGAQTFFNSLHENLNKLAEHENWLVGFSIGVAVFQSPTCSLDQAIRLADELMYEIKHSGKNKVRYKLIN